MYHDDLDRMLTRWIDDPVSVPAPPYLGAVLERTRRTRQRPAWASLERWLPMSDKILARPASPPMRVARLALVALVVLALAITAAVVGSQLLRSKPAIPEGGSAVFTFGSIVQTNAFGGEAGDIYTVRADGTDLRRLTAEGTIDVDPAFSPDGTHIAFRAYDDGTRSESIVVMDAGGGDQRVLATSPVSSPECMGTGHAWSPDGKRLVYATNRDCGGALDLFVVSVDGSSPAARLLPEGTSGRFAAWSPDGTRIAFLGSEGGSSNAIYVVDVPSAIPAGGLPVYRVADGFAGLLADGQSGPRWSPDGSELAADNGAPVFDDGSKDGFSIIRADGSGERLSVPEGHAPEWSPDGKRVAFVRRVDRSEWFDDRPCTVRLWVIDADGTGERRLDPLADGCGTGPVWSPDGTRLTGLLIAATPTQPEVAFHVGVVTVDGSSPPVILPDGGAMTWQPVVAPLPAAPSFAAESPAP